MNIDHTPRARGGDGAVGVLEAPPFLNQDGEVDPVLAAMEDARKRYEEARAAWQRQLAGLAEARSEAALARQARNQVEEEIQQVRDQLAHERRRAERHKERAKRLAEGLKTVHRALFDGNVYGLILKACLAITGATRGLYLTAWGGDKLRVRAAVDVDGYPQAQPSEFIRALCWRTLRNNETVVCNDPEEQPDLPTPSAPGESFRNFLVAPVVLHGNFNGVLILADKLDGAFDKEDVDTVLSVGDQAAVAIENRRLQDTLLTAYFNVVGVLADAVEAKDPYTHGHSEQVARLSRLTAERLRLPDGERSVACYGGLLHDVGKIGVSDGVLNKPGKLMPEEWDLMRSHVRVGRDLLSRVPVLSRVAEVALHHHERWDGTGYPDGLAGEQISLASRIVCVVDSYSAMVAKRCYKESSTEAEARAELIRCKGSQFDPAVVDAFLAVLDEPPSPEEDCPDTCSILPGDFHHVLHTPDGLAGPPPVIGSDKEPAPAPQPRRRKKNGAQ